MTPPPPVSSLVKLLHGKLFSLKAFGWNSSPVHLKCTEFLGPNSLVATSKRGLEFQPKAFKLNDFPRKSLNMYIPN